MRDRCAVPRTLFQCVCTQHRNRIGRFVAIFGICAFGEPVQAESFVAIKSDPLPRTRVLDVARTASCWLRVGCISGGGNDVDVNRFRREVSAEPGGVCLLEDTVEKVQNSAAPRISRISVFRCFRRAGFIDSTWERGSRINPQRRYSA